MVRPVSRIDTWFGGRKRRAQVDQGWDADATGVHQQGAVLRRKDRGST